MRRRLVTAFVGLAVAVLLLFGVPRGFVVGSLVQSQRQELLERSADLATYAVTDAAGDGQPVTPEMLAPIPLGQERLEYDPADGPAVVVPSGSAEPSDDDLTAERTLPGGATLVVSYPRAEVREDILEALWPIVVLAGLVVALAALAGWVIARRLARPFTELAGVAEVFGRGHLDAEVPHYDIAEADAIGRALEDSSRALRRMMRRQREVSDYASHDLRTPITALRLSLEDLSMWPATPPDVAEELNRIVGEVDRFSRAVASLVDTPVEGEPPELVDVAALVRQAVREQHGDTVSVGGAVADAPVLARLPKVAATRAIALLLEEAGTTGRPTVRIVDSSGYVTVELELPAETWRGHPRGAVWDQAVALTVELGGRLSGTRRPDGSETWSLTLPKEAASVR